MNWKLTAGIALAVVGALVVIALVIHPRHAGPPVTVILRIAVTPGQQLEFVTGQANSARFKYLVGKQSGVKPGLAQRLYVKPVTNSSLVEARVGVLTKEEGGRYARVFVETLQALCGKRAQLVLAEQSIR